MSETQLKSTTVGVGAPENHKDKCQPQVQNEADDELLKPDVSYIEMIARAILDAPEKKLCLQDIYGCIEKKYPYFRKAHPGWRNSVRHNLSLHECFCKGERCENGKGHYWCIHPANLDDFQRGDFRRRLVKARVRRMQAMYMHYHPYAPELGYSCATLPLQYYTPVYNGAMPYAMSIPYLYYPTPTSTVSFAPAYSYTGAHVSHQQPPHQCTGATNAISSGTASGTEKNGVVFSVKNILSKE